MDHVIGFLSSLIVLGLLIIVHELGHLLVARMSGVRVLRFSIGFGPQLFTWTKGHTEYAVSAIPLGGYVKMAGEQRSEQTAAPWEYLSKPASTRASIVFAGPFVNYLVSFVLLWIVCLVGFPVLVPTIGRVIDHSPAATAGLQVGDHLVEVDGHRVTTWDEMTEMIHNAPDRPIAVLLQRGAETHRLLVTPEPGRGQDLFGRSKAGIGIGPAGESTAQRYGPLAALRQTLQVQRRQLEQTFTGLALVFSGKLPLKDSVAGPIRIMTETSAFMRLGLVPALLWMSALSLSLSIFNVLPIPILDGGHLFFLLIEQLRGRPVSIGVQERSTQVSFVLLMALIVFVCINDLDQIGLLGKIASWVRR